MLNENPNNYGSKLHEIKIYNKKSIENWWSNTKTISFLIVQNWFFICISLLPFDIPNIMMEALDSPMFQFHAFP